MISDFSSFTEKYISRFAQEKKTLRFLTKSLRASVKFKKCVKHTAKLRWYQQQLNAGGYESAALCRYVHDRVPLTDFHLKCAEYPFNRGLQQSHLCKQT